MDIGMEFVGRAGEPIFGGYNVVIAGEVPRYTLPECLLPGVPLPKEFRDEFNAWSREFLGITYSIVRGTSYVVGRTVYMHPDDYQAVRNPTLLRSTVGFEL